MKNQPARWKHKAGVFVAVLALVGCVQNEGVDISATESTKKVGVERLVALGFPEKDLQRTEMDGGGYLWQGDILLSDEAVDLIEARANTIDDVVPRSLGKGSQTRWDVTTAGSSLFDVKNLVGVSSLKIWIDPAVHADWQAAFLAALPMWSDITLGSTIRISATSNYNLANIRVINTYVLPSGGQPAPVASASVSPGSDIVARDIKVNTYHPASNFTYEKKLMGAIHEIGHLLQFMHTDQEGAAGNFNFNTGVQAWIPGTTHGDAASVMKSSLTPPNHFFSENDKLAIRALYPMEALYTFQANQGVHSGISQVLNTAVQSFYAGYNGAEQPYFIWQTDGQLWFKSLENDNYSVQIWPSTGSTGLVASFQYVDGYWAVLTTTGNLYTKVGGASWVNQGPALDYRISGQRVVKVGSDGDLHSKLLISSPNTWTFEREATNGAGTYIVDFQVQGDLIVISQSGIAYSKVGGGGWTNLNTNGDVRKVFLSPTHIAVILDPLDEESPNYFVAWRPISSGSWTVEPDAVTNNSDVHLCGQRLAAIKWGTYLDVVDLNTGTSYANYSRPGGSLNADAVQLSGTNCDYLSVIDNSGILWAKYSFQGATDFQQYQSGASQFSLRR